MKWWSMAVVAVHVVRHEVVEHGCSMAVYGWHRVKQEGGASGGLVVAIN